MNISEITSAKLVNLINSLDGLLVLNASFTSAATDEVVEAAERCKTLEKLDLSPAAGQLSKISQIAAKQFRINNPNCKLKI